MIGKEENCLAPNNREIGLERCDSKNARQSWELQKDGQLMNLGTKECYVSPIEMSNHHHPLMGRCRDGAAYLKWQIFDHKYLQSSEVGGCIYLSSSNTQTLADCNEKKSSFFEVV